VPRLKQRTTALRERGVACALAVLMDEGVAGLTARAVARRADASVPAIYEVFGAKAGLIREVFFEGFRMLGDDLRAIPTTADPLEDLERCCDTFRQFLITNTVLAEIMFTRPFIEFEPSTEDNQIGLGVSKNFVKRARAAIDAGLLEGDPTDIAHLFFAFVQGMAAAENAKRLGGSKRAVDRRWRLGLTALIDGLRPASVAMSTATRRRSAESLRR
jgi:AcrR family transcriptional regulator